MGTLRGLHGDYDTVLNESILSLVLKLSHAAPVEEGSSCRAGTRHPESFLPDGTPP